MRVAVVAPSPVPFRTGGAERLFEGLVRAISDLTDHSADLIKLPTPESNLPEILDSYRRFTRLDVSQFDLVITTKYPAWMINHDNKIVYLQHPLRGLYDTYHFTEEPTKVLDAPRGLEALIASTDEGSSVRPEEVLDLAEEAIVRIGSDQPVFRFPGPLVRRIVHSLDGWALAPPRTRRHYCISRTVANRHYFPSGVRATAVYHPSSLTGFRTGRHEYFFTASRLDGPKRIGLLIEAYLETNLALPLLIAGTGDELPTLQELAGGDSRIEFLGHVDDRTLLDLYADALAVVFVPYDEDLGLITLEAMLSGKPLISCSDSGGPTELVRHGVNGLIAEPDVKSLAAALEEMTAERAGSMEQAALEKARSVTWDRVVGALVEDEDSGSYGSFPRIGRTSAGRPKVVFLSTYPFFPATGGGQIRGARLAEALLSEFDVEIIAPALRRSKPAVTNPRPGLRQRTVKWPERLEAMEDEWLAAASGVPISDIVAGLTAVDSSRLRRAAQEAMTDAEVIVVSHPFLASLAAEGGQRSTVILDAVDVELVQKSQSLRGTAAGPYLVRGVEALEREAIRLADRIQACSTEDRLLLQQTYGVPPGIIDLLPNGTDTSNVRFVSLPRRRAIGAAVRPLEPRYDGLALFVGSWHPPNLEAARRILDMAIDLRNVMFVMAGSHTLYFDNWRLPPNVAMLGVVSEALKNGLMAFADLALNPMTNGSGTNLKMLEWFSAGVPVVSTDFGARGINAQPGQHFVHSALPDFPEVIRSVLADPRRELENMVISARELVEREYDWREIGRHFRLRVLELTGRGSDDTTTDTTAVDQS